MNPGFAKKTINLIDNIVYSHQKDLNGNPMELKMSIMLQNGNSEMRLAAGEDDPKEDNSPKPALLWIPGGGWRGADKNLMLGEMSEFARAGYVVASMYYRSSAEGHWPDQLIDVKTAIRFLRANAEKYEINPDKIAVFGRSAGGHLAAFAAVSERRGRRSPTMCMPAATCSDPQTLWPPWKWRRRSLLIPTSAGIPWRRPMAALFWAEIRRP